MILTRIGYHGMHFYRSIQLFICFFGHLNATILNVILGRVSIKWKLVTMTIYYSGAKLVVPFILISSLLASTMSINIHNLLSAYRLEREAIIILQQVATVNLIPIFIGTVLLVQSSLGLTKHYIKGMHYQRQETIEVYIIPIMFGLLFVGFERWGMS